MPLDTNKLKKPILLHPLLTDNGVKFTTTTHNKSWTTTLLPTKPIKLTVLNGERISPNSEKESTDPTKLWEDKLKMLGKPTESKLMRPLKVLSETLEKP